MPAADPRAVTVDAALALALEAAPRWADTLFAVMVTARDGAPQGLGEAWADQARDAFLRQIGDVGDHIAARAGATDEQTAAFARRVADTMHARFAALKAAGAATQGGQA